MTENKETKRYIITYATEAHLEATSEKELSIKLMQLEASLDSNRFANTRVTDIQDFDNIPVEVPTE